MVNAFTDPGRYKYGWDAGNVKRALINIRVSLPENPTVSQELELPPVWALLEQRPDYLDLTTLDLDKLGKDLEEIVPLIRACLPQG